MRKDRALRSKRLLGLALAGALACLFSAEAGADENSPAPVILEHEVQFQTESGGDVILDPGNYFIQVSAGAPLRVSPEFGDASHALQAVSGRHEESLDEAVAESIHGEVEHHLVLLLPDGTSIDAIGSYTGVVTRDASAVGADRIRQFREQQENLDAVMTRSDMTLRVPPTKPEATQYVEGLYRNVIVVKFVEGAPVRPVGNRSDARATLAVSAPLMTDARRQVLQRTNLTEAQVQADIARANAILAQESVERLVPYFDRNARFLRHERRRARDASQTEQADLANYYVARLREGSQGEQLADQLNALQAVEIAYLAPVPRPAQVATPNFQGSQGYLKAAPEGIDAIHAWTKPGGKGNGIKVIDLEYGWNKLHEDLPAPFVEHGTIMGAGVCADTTTSACSWREHGTAVAGQIVGKANGLGVTGIVHNASYGFVSVDRPVIGFNIANALNYAAGRLSPGDVILIEQQVRGPASGVACDPACHNNCTPAGTQYELVAVEWNQAEFDAIKAATSLGIHVVEAAGNGGQNFDAPQFLSRFDRNTRDSGAIIVGAGDATHDTGTSRAGAPMCWSNYGNRIDVQGWGTNIVTTGYGDHPQTGPNDVKWYTNSFGGTSGASPIVTGAVASLMGIQRARGQRGIGPAEMRSLLTSTGSLQKPGVAGAGQRNTTGHLIGPLPNLRVAIGRLRSDDCIGFDPTRITASNVGGAWKVVEGSHWLLHFGRDQADAVKAKNIIQHYGLRKTCYVGRPGPSMSYWLGAADAVPTGAFPDEQCHAFDPAKLLVKRVGGRWKLTADATNLSDFGNQQLEANAAKDLVLRHGFTHKCFVTRANKRMNYWRK